MSPEHARPGVGRLPWGSWICVAIGLLLVATGAVVYRRASPSPHGYIELFFAIPMIASGLLVGGLGLVIPWHTVGVAGRTIGLLLICVGAMPLGLLLLLLLTGC